ncbi:MAG: ATP-binding protein [bacterium]|nr:ATP-binding protein [bacterium]
MYSRLLKPPVNKSFFLFGPRGTGKTTWVRSNFPNAVYYDLLNADVNTRLTSSPTRLGKSIPKNFTDWIIIDEIQMIPELLNEVHRLIENKHYKFILTGSSARKLRRGGVNLLGGRAVTCYMHPLTAVELGNDFDLFDNIKYGALPSIFLEHDKVKYLAGYVNNYLQQEVVQEGISRNAGSFARFLETASFSQGSVLNTSEVAREAAVPRKTVEDYFTALEDLLIGVRLPVFSRRAKRRLITHSKFYYFDAGVYRAIRPTGPLDDPRALGGVAMESLFFQNLRAVNDYFDLRYDLFYWRTANDLEVDFVVYGERGLKAFEIKSGENVSPSDLRGLKAFLSDYPEAKGYLIYAGEERLYEDNIEIIPASEAFLNLPKILAN